MTFTLERIIERGAQTVGEGIDEVEEFLSVYGYIVPAVKNRPQHYFGDLTAKALRPYTISKVSYRLNVVPSVTHSKSIVRLTLIVTELPPGTYARIRSRLSFYGIFRIRISALSTDMTNRINRMV